MTEIPKIVQDRLRITAQAPQHPDANQLTAFAEQSLSASERDSVLRHLALCGDCRDILALALPASDDFASPVFVAEPASNVARPALPAKAPLAWPRLAWPTLRWASLAAGVALAAVVLTMHPKKPNQAMIPSANPPATTPVAQLAPPVSMSPVSSPVVQQPATKLLARNRQPSERTKKAGTPSPAMAFAPSSSSTAVEVTSGVSQTLTTETASFEVAMAAPAAPPIEKAKPALQAPDLPPQSELSPASNQAPQTDSPAGAAARKSMAGMSSAKRSVADAASAQLILAAPKVTWQISGGALKKSVDSGRNWQNAFHPDRPLLCYASIQQDVWAGGVAGTLFHSSDNGVTWTTVQPAIHDLHLSADITSINLKNGQEFTLTTASHELWSTPDGGKTWQRN